MLTHEGRSNSPVYIFHDYFSEFQCIDIKSEIGEIVLYISHMIK